MAAVTPLRVILIVIAAICFLIAYVPSVYHSLQVHNFSHFPLYWILGYGGMAIAWIVYYISINSDRAKEEKPDAVGLSDLLSYDSSNGIIFYSCILAFVAIVGISRIVYRKNVDVDMQSTSSVELSSKKDQ